MPIPVTCPTCGARANAPDAAAGRGVTCRKCGGAFLGPRGPSLSVPVSSGASSPPSLGATTSAVGSYPQMHRLLALVRLGQRVRAACDATGMGSTSGPRLCLLLIVAAVLFGVSLVASFLLGDGPIYAALQASAIGAAFFAIGAVLILWGSDEELIALAESLEAALPAAYAKWEQERQELRERLEQERSQRRAEKQRQREEAEQRRKKLERERQSAAELRALPDVMPATKRCPYCAETIPVEARKCGYCGEYLDRRLIPRPRVIPRPRATKSAATAALLEVLPGMFVQTFGIGHIYAGNVALGLFIMFGYWFVFAVNLLLILACGIGIVTHVFCFLLTLVLSTITAANSAEN